MPDPLLPDPATDPAALHLVADDGRRVPLSVLDLASVAAGTSHGDALRRTTRLAQHVEALGYQRIWVAEHHNMPQIASSAPDVLAAHLLASTDRIRVGSGGVMLGNHAPLVVAERFATLAALHPGRVDLGLGRAPGTDQRTARALRRDESALDGQAFVDQLHQLRGFVTGQLPPDHPFAGIRAVPGGPDLLPPFVLLGSSGFSAQVAGHLGQRFAFAHHFSAANTLPALELYRSTFRPSDDLEAPHAIVTVTVICAGTDAEAERIAASMALSIVRLRQGRPTELASPEEAAAHDWTDVERRIADGFLADQVIGGPATVEARLRDLLERTAADELMVTGHVHDEVAHRDGYARVAEIARRSTVPEPTSTRAGSS